MRRLLFLLVVAISFPIIGLAQFETEPTPQAPPKAPADKPAFKDRIFVGGGLGAQFGTLTAIEVSPLVGFQLSDRAQAGVSFTYRYYEDKNFGFSTNTYGGGAFGRYFLFENVFAHAEYEALNGEWNTLGNRYFIHSLFLGGGYMQRIGNSFAGIMVLWNINDSAYNPYVNPVIRATFGIGF